MDTSDLTIANLSVELEKKTKKNSAKEKIYTFDEAIKEARKSHIDFSPGK